MSNELLEEIEDILPSLEAIREAIFQQEATKSNRSALDEAYESVARSIRALAAMSE